MKDCSLDTDRLLEWLDSPAHAEELEEHLRHCSQCAGTARLFRGLGEQLAPRGICEEPSSDFAARVAAEILSRRSGSQRLLGWCRKRMQHLLQPNAVSALLDIKRRKQPTLMPRLIPLALLYLLPGFYYAVVVPDLFRFYLGSCMGLLVLAIPVYVVQTESGLLKSLYQGRCLEELSTSGVSAAMMVDTLACHCLKRIVPLAVGTSLLLCPSTWYFLTHHHNEVTLNQVHWLGQILALWIPAVTVALVGGSYAYQAFISGTQQNVRQSLGFYAGLTVLIGCLIWSSFDTLSLVSGTFSPSLPVQHLRFVVPGLALLFLQCLAALLSLAGLRALAIHRYNASTLGLGGFTSVSKRKASRWTAVGPGANPILAREMARRGLPSAALVISAVFCWFWMAHLNTENNLTELLTRFGYQLLMLAVVGACNFGLSTCSVVSQERQRGTWEALLQTRLTTREFVAGWLGASYRTMFWWLLLLPILAVAGRIGLACPWPWVIWVFPPAMVATLLLTARAAAGVGLVVALDSKSGRTSITAISSVIGKLTLALVQYGVLLTYTQKLVEFLGQRGRGWTEGWNMFHHAGLPWLCLVGLASGWLLWSQARLRSLQSVGCLSELGPVASRSWWRNPQWITVAATVVGGASRGGGFSLPLLALAWGFVLSWLLAPLDSHLQRAPRGPAAWAGRLLLGTVALSFPLLFQELLVPYQVSLYLGGLWFLPVAQVAPLSLLTGLGWSAVFTWVWSAYQAYRDPRDMAASHNDAVSGPFLRRLAWASSLGVLGCLGVLGWLRCQFALTPAQRDDVRAVQRQVSFDVKKLDEGLLLGHETPTGRSGEPRSLYLRGASCVPRLLSADFRKELAKYPKADRPHYSHSHFVAQELLAAGLVQESRGLNEEALQSYLLSLSWTSPNFYGFDSQWNRILRELGAFVGECSLSSSQLQTLSLALRDQDGGYAGLVHSVRVLSLREQSWRIRQVGVNVAIEPEWCRDYRTWRTLQACQADLESCAPGSSQPPGERFRGQPILQNLLCSYRLLKTLELEIELQEAYLRDGRYPAQAPASDLPPSWITYKSNGATCELSVFSCDGFSSHPIRLSQGKH